MAPYAHNPPCLGSLRPYAPLPCPSALDCRAAGPTPEPSNLFAPGPQVLAVAYHSAASWGPRFAFCLGLIFFLTHVLAVQALETLTGIKVGHTQQAAKYVTSLHRLDRSQVLDSITFEKMHKTTARCNV